MQFHLAAGGHDPACHRHIQLFTLHTGLRPNLHDERVDSFIGSKKRLQVSEFA
jgi:hypothetical protein